MRLYLSDVRGLDAQVEAEGVRSRRTVVYVDLEARPVESVRLLRGTTEHDLASIIDRVGADPDAIADALITTDLDVDVEQFGRRLEETARIYVNADGGVARGLNFEEVRYAPNGEERSREERVAAEANVDEAVPLAWTGRTLSREAAVRRFVFSRTLQLRHRTGLEYDFLFRMASALAEQDALMLVGAGDSGREPLVFRRGGRGYRGFLEGRVRDTSYLLLLHLSQLELKPPAEAEVHDAAG